MWAGTSARARTRPACCPRPCGRPAGRTPACQARLPTQRAGAAAPHAWAARAQALPVRQCMGTCIQSAYVHRRTLAPSVSHGDRRDAIRHMWKLWKLSKMCAGASGLKARGLQLATRHHGAGPLRRAPHDVLDAVGVVLAQHGAQAVVPEARRARGRAGAAAARRGGDRKHAELHGRAQHAKQPLRVDACARRRSHAQVCPAECTRKLPAGKLGLGAGPQAWCCKASRRAPCVAKCAIQDEFSVKLASRQSPGTRAALGCHALGFSICVGGAWLCGKAAGPHRALRPAPRPSWARPPARRPRPAVRTCR
jgi:hypothetical protein